VRRETEKRGWDGRTDNVLLSELFGDGFGSETRDLHPDLGEGGRHGEEQHSVEEHVEGIEQEFCVGDKGSGEGREGRVPRMDCGGEM
jgi:hypothetical protein